MTTLSFITINSVKLRIMISYLVFIAIQFDTQQSIQNYTIPDDDQKYGQNRLSRRYWTIPLPSRSRL